jgi:hypothetical protein
VCGAVALKKGPAAGWELAAAPSARSVEYPPIHKSKSSEQWALLRCPRSRYRRLQVLPVLLARCKIGDFHEFLILLLSVNSTLVTPPGRRPRGAGQRHFCLKVLFDIKKRVKLLLQIRRQRPRQELHHKLVQRLLPCLELGLA